MDVKVFDQDESDPGQDDQDQPKPKKPLRGADYYDMLVSDLTKHEDFSEHAYRVVAAVMMMTTKQLEKLDVSSLKNQETT